MYFLTDLPANKLRIVFATFLVAFNVLFWFVLKPIDNELVKLQKTERPQPEDLKWRAYNTFHLQMFFWYHFDTQEILTQWGEEGRRLARRSLLYDFALMPTYAFCLAAFYLLLAAATTDGWRTTFGWLLSSLPK